MQGGGTSSASTNNQNIFLALTLPSGVTSTNTFISGINAGTGNVRISGPSVNIIGSGTINAGNLNISGLSVVLDDVEATSLAATPPMAALSTSRR